MSGKMWTKELIKHLIREFKKHELLYDPTHVHHSNREERKNSLEDICNALKKHNSEVTVECVKKKITTLRGQFSTANKLKAEYIENAVDEDDICQPILWCYDELSFLSDCKSKALEACSLKRVWAELDQMQRKFRKEMDNTHTSVTYEDKPLTSGDSTKRIINTKLKTLQSQSLPSPDVVVPKDDVAVKQEFHHKDPLLLRTSSITVATPEIKSYTEPADTNPTSDIEETDVVPLLHEQLQMQTRQLEVIGSMLKSIESLSQQQMKAMKLKTAAIERQTEATERQTAALGDLMLVYREGKCDREDLTDIIYMD